MNLTGTFTAVGAIRRFCAASDLFTVHLARRLADPDTRPRVTVTCIKLGVVETGIRRGFPGWMKVLVPLVMDPFLGQTAEEAARDVLGLVGGPDFEGTSGALFLKIRRLKRISIPAHLVPDDGLRLWRLSEQLFASARTDVRERRQLAAPISQGA